MTKVPSEVVVSFSAVFFLGIALGLLVGTIGTTQVRQHQALEHGLAFYHPQTGMFTLKTCPQIQAQASCD